MRGAPRARKCASTTSRGQAHASAAFAGIPNNWRLLWIPLIRARDQVAAAFGLPVCLRMWLRPTV